MSIGARSIRGRRRGTGDPDDREGVHPGLRVRPTEPGGAACAADRSVLARRPVLVVAVALLAAEVPAAGRFAPRTPADPVAADLLAAPPAPEVAGRVRRDGGGVAHDAQRPLRR